MKTDAINLDVIDMGTTDYGISMETQNQMVLDRIAGKTKDRLLFVQHPAVISIGRSGNKNDLKIAEAQLQDRNIAVIQTTRGGKLTYHCPGQLVAYPIVKLTNKDIHQYVNTLLDVVVSVLKSYRLHPILKKGVPGVWIENRKIASIGIAIKKWVTYHGIALNISADMGGFDCIVPCGNPDQIVTSMEAELGRPVNFDRVQRLFEYHFKKKFGYDSGTNFDDRPLWLTIPAHDEREAKKVEYIIKEKNLTTVCQSAHCPNLAECFSKGTATFMILGRRCTRKCRFCAVEKGIPEPVSRNEPGLVAKAIAELGLKYTVITSVTRDDLPDGGAHQFVATINQIRLMRPDSKIEVLVPDFNGNRSAVRAVCDAKPDMFNHNIETVSKLYAKVRPIAQYSRSLKILSEAADAGLSVKSGIMLGLGESSDDIRETLYDLRQAGCTHLTLGQYLSPSKNHFPIDRYVLPEEFEEWKRIAESLGFLGVASGPLVRSSYHAEQFYLSGMNVKKETDIQNLMDCHP